MTATETAALRPLLAAAAAADAVPSSMASVALAGQVGGEVAAALSSALERVELLIRSGRIGQHSLQVLHDDIARARRVAILGQQVSRLAAGQVHQSPEVLELSQLLREAVAQRSDDIAAHGIELRQRLQPAAVSMDPTLLFSLLLSLLDWALEHGRAQTVTLTTSLNTWPVHAVLQCDFVWRAPDRLGPDAELAFEAERDERGEDGTALDTMAWRMVAQACKAMNVRIDRHDSLCNVHLTLAFPEAPRCWPALAEDPQVPDPERGLVDRPLAGCRVLLLGTRAELRRVLAETLLAQGSMVDEVGNQHDALALARDTQHDVVVVDARNSEIDRALAELKAGGSGPALVHVCNVRGLEISTTGRFEIVRVGSDTAARDLPAGLRYALSSR